MPTKRQRASGSWEFIVRRKGQLPAPLSMTFATEAEGDEYCRRLEALLDKGIVPPEFAVREQRMKTLRVALREYQLAVPVSAGDAPILASLSEDIGDTQLRAVNTAWVETWIAGMKRIDNLAPGTIRHRVGALARCLDWCVRRHDPDMLVNPARGLRRGYASYSAGDEAVATSSGGKARVDVERDRRLAAGEEQAIRAVLAGHPADLLFLEFALETAMRLREIYTLTAAQVDCRRKTIFLERTKNGSSRQVPMSTLLIAKVQGKLHPGLIFPWWDGNRATLKKTTTYVSKLFAEVFEAAKCEDLTFHDLRHEATCRFYERTTLTDVQIARITGHKDLRMLRRYASLRGSDLAGKLW